MQGYLNSFAQASDKIPNLPIRLVLDVRAINVPLALGDKEIGVHVHDRSADLFGGKFGVLNRFGPMSDRFIINIKRNDHVLAAIHAGKAMRLTCFLSHTDANGMELAARTALEGRSDNHRLFTRPWLSLGYVGVSAELY